MDATGNHANERTPAADCQPNRGSSGRPFQFSLKTLLIIVAIVPPAVGLASGALGETAQALAMLTVIGLVLVFAGWTAIIIAMLLVAFSIIWLLDLIGKAGEALFQRRRRS